MQEIRNFFSFHFLTIDRGINNIFLNFALYVFEFVFLFQFRVLKEKVEKDND